MMVEVARELECYKRFMQIAEFPKFEVEYFEPDINMEYTAAAQAVYDFQTGKHTLIIPSSFEPSKHLLYHEFTHIIDTERYKTGDKTHDFALTGFTEYHASQVELMAIVGSKDIRECIRFSMKCRIIELNKTVQQYLEDKLIAASDLMNDSSQEKRINGVGVFFNFLGLKSICNMYAEDFVEEFSLRKVADLIPSFLIYNIRQTMIGMNVDVEMAIGLYSHAVQYVI